MAKGYVFRFIRGRVIAIARSKAHSNRTHTSISKRVAKNVARKKRLNARAERVNKKRKILQKISGARTFGGKGGSIGRSGKKGFINEMGRRTPASAIFSKSSSLDDLTKAKDRAQLGKAMLRLRKEEKQIRAVRKGLERFGGFSKAALVRFPETRFLTKELKKVTKFKSTRIKKR